MTSIFAGPREDDAAPTLAAALQPLHMTHVDIRDGFWAVMQRRNATAILPHADEWLRQVGSIDNFLPPDRRPTPQRRGRHFTDSDVYKYLEALVWESARTGDPAFEDRIAELTAIIAYSLEDDGYLNTYYGRYGVGARYTDLMWGHELYCAGHLIQAGVARLRTRGADPLTELAVRVADRVCADFGPGSEERICGHPEIELALTELYSATGAARYLDTAAALVHRRGHGLLGEGRYGAGYYQDDTPVREARTLRGHAVRALYLACGAADVAMATGDRELLNAVIQQWSTAVARRTYLTGGMGARHEDESFGDDYELPADRAYAETCAGIAAVMLAWRLLVATGDASYGDHIERILYNVVAASPAMDGRSFFYTNTLHQRTPSTPLPVDLESQRAAAGLRAAWYPVPCCPTNIARLLASLGGYVATTDAIGVQVHQYATGTITAQLPDGSPVTLDVHANYPWHGRIEVTVRDCARPDWTLTLRVPSWARSATVAVAGQMRPVEPGRTTIARFWSPGDTAVLDLPMPPRWTQPAGPIDAIRGCVALERGPLVYCLESIDQLETVDLDRLVVDPATPAAETSVDGLGNARGLRVAAASLPALAQTTWPYQAYTKSVEAGELSRPPSQPTAPADQGGADPRRVALSFIPYHLWANRGPSTMRVWVPAGHEMI